MVARDAALHCTNRDTLYSADNATLCGISNSSSSSTSSSTSSRVTDSEARVRRSANTVHEYLEKSKFAKVCNNTSHAHTAILYSTHFCAVECSGLVLV
jgi:hypothetical protein